MKISVKGRYSLASMIFMAKNNAQEEYIGVTYMSETLNISSIYLEQVFSILKDVGLIRQHRDNSDLYILSKSPNSITVLDVLSSVETNLFEKTQSTLSNENFGIEKVMQSCVFNSIDSEIMTVLQSITLEELWLKTVIYSQEENDSFFL